MNVFATKKDDTMETLPRTEITVKEEAELLNELVEDLSIATAEVTGGLISEPDTVMIPTPEPHPALCSSKSDPNLTSSLQQRRASLAELSLCVSDLDSKVLLDDDSPPFLSGEERPCVPKSVNVCNQQGMTMTTDGPFVPMDPAEDTASTNEAFPEEEREAEAATETDGAADLAGPQPAQVDSVCSGPRITPPTLEEPAIIATRDELAFTSFGLVRSENEHERGHDGDQQLSAAMHDASTYAQVGNLLAMEPSAPRSAIAICGSALWGALSAVVQSDVGRVCCVGCAAMFIPLLIEQKGSTMDSLSMEESTSLPLNATMYAPVEDDLLIGGDNDGDLAWNMTWLEDTATPDDVVAESTLVASFVLVFFATLLGLAGISWIMVGAGGWSDLSPKGEEKKIDETTLDALKQMNHVNLKAECKRRGMPVTGNKADLIYRLSPNKRRPRALNVRAYEALMTTNQLKQELKAMGLPHSNMIKSDLAYKCALARAERLDKVNRDELRHVLKRHGLSTAGLKKDLVRRLVEAGPIVGLRC